MAKLICPACDVPFIRAFIEQAYCTPDCFEHAERLGDLKRKPSKAEEAERKRLAAEYRRAMIAAVPEPAPQPKPEGRRKRSIFSAWE